MRFYCLEHNKDFYTEFKWGAHVVCEVNQHDLPRRFPDEPFWEHCCLCEATWVAGTQDYPSRAICPACNRKLKLGYLCHTCETFGLKPAEDLNQTANEETKCGACSADLSYLRWHYCVTLGKPFLSKRDECPLCDASFFPIAASDLLARMKGRNSRLACINDLEVEDLLLSPTSTENQDEVQFFVIAGDHSAIVVPRYTTRAMIDKGARKYQQVFDWPGDWSGDIVIEKPAIFELIGKNWRLKEYGKLAGDVAIRKDASARVQPHSSGYSVALSSQNRRDQNEYSLGPQSSLPTQPESEFLDLPDLERSTAEVDLELLTEPESAEHTTSLDFLSADEKAVGGKSFGDPSLAKSKSLYRSLVSGEALSTEALYLSVRDTSLDMPEAINVFLREVDNERGAFVLFVDSYKHGWLFPNPHLNFRTADLAPIFPSLTEREYANFKPSIEPVPAIRAGRKVWKVTSRERWSPQTSTRDATTAKMEREETNKIPAKFPISAADYREKMRRFENVVCPNFQNGILVRDSTGKGELVLIRDSNQPDESQRLFLIPSITRFQTKQKFFAYYEKYYDCEKPSAGDIWIIDPATVAKVEGGWRLKKRGVLEVREAPAQRESPRPRPQSKQHRPSESQTPTPSTKASHRKIRPLLVGAAILTLGLIFLVIVTWKLVSGPHGNPQHKNDLMVRVEGGDFLMGRNDGEENERPQHKVTVKSFYIDTYEVTREDYKKFIDATNHRAPAGWGSSSYLSGTGRWPVTGVDWYDASAYAKWAGKRLPTEEEWELAAKGLDGRKYPWGNDWNPAYANAENASQGLTDIDKFQGATKYGAIGMIGNAWEWTATKLVAYPGGRIPPQELGDGTVDLRVIRGGSWQSDRSSATTTYRWGWQASGGLDYSNTGFRCVKDAQ
jgi:formylglycine-generating enzyme required for sulfatase activity